MQTFLNATKWTPCWCCSTSDTWVYHGSKIYRFEIVLKERHEKTSKQMWIYFGMSESHLVQKPAAQRTVSDRERSTVTERLLTRSAHAISYTLYFVILSPSCPCILCAGCCSATFMEVFFKIKTQQLCKKKRERESGKKTFCINIFLFSVYSLQNWIIVFSSTHTQCLILLGKWKNLPCWLDRSSQLSALNVLKVFHPKNEGNSFTFKILLWNLTSLPTSSSACG